MLSWHLLSAKGAKRAFSACVLGNRAFGAEQIPRSAAQSILGEKLALARIDSRGHVTIRGLEALLAQPGGSVFALLLCDGAYA